MGPWGGRECSANGPGSGPREESVHPTSVLWAGSTLRPLHQPCRVDVGNQAGACPFQIQDPVLSWCRCEPPTFYIAS